MPLGPLSPDDLRAAMEAHAVFERPLVDGIQALLDRLDAGLEVEGKVWGIPCSFTIKARPQPQRAKP